MAKVNCELLYPELYKYVNEEYDENAAKKTFTGQSSFSDTLFSYLKESSMTEAQCYRKANVDKKLFNKIKADKLYKPKKSTAIAFSLSLELPIKDMERLLESAGYELSRSNKSDIVIKYYVENNVFTLALINEALYSFELPMLVP